MDEAVAYILKLPSAQGFAPSEGFDIDCISVYDIEQVISVDEMFEAWQHILELDLVAA